jgi:segregation and condensation protein A
MKNESCFLDVNNFVGPLDLLLELIERNNLSISRIALSQVADQYFDYAIKNRVSLEELTGFLEIASKLALIKSLSLIPLHDASFKEKEKEVSDFELRVFIYSKFRKAALALKKSYSKKTCFARQMLLVKNDIKKQDLQDLNVQLEDLEIVFRKLLNKLPNLSILKEETVQPRIAIGSIIKLIVKRLVTSKKASFLNFSKDMNRAETILAFLASLELARRTKVKLRQEEFLGDILIFGA